MPHLTGLRAAKLTTVALKPAIPIWTRLMTSTASSPARGSGF
jgi:hypothetical protein